MDTKAALRRGQAGQAIVWVAVMLPLFLSIIGLAIDGGMVFNARRELQNVADASARAGANQIDLRVYDASNGRTMVLDRDAAAQVATEYIALQGLPVDASISTGTQRVAVRVQRDVPTSFLQLFGLTHVRIGATASAEVRRGIREESH